MSKFPRSRHPLCILAYIYIRQGAQEKERRQSRIGLFDGIRMNGSTASYICNKGRDTQKKREKEELLDHSSRSIHEYDEGETPLGYDVADEGDPLRELQSSSPSAR